MAKINHILFGQGKGKVGGLVLQRYEGMNVVREKPIDVKNPQSTKQTEQRAKFKLASQLVAQFSKTLNMRLAKLSIYNRTRRGAAINAIVNVIKTATPATPEALVNDVIAALNAKSVSGIAGPTISDVNNNATNITAPDGDTVVYTAVQYDVNGAPLSIEQNQYESDGTVKSVEVFSTAETESAVVMAVSFHALTEEGRATISNIQGDDTAWVIEVSRGVAAGDIEISNLTGRGFKA